MILSTLPEEALAAHPFALVQVARLAERTVDFELRLALLEQALALLGDGPKRREAEAELVATRAGDRARRRDRGGRPRDPRGRRAGRDGHARRALTALARVDAWRGEPATMLRAEGYLAQAAALCRIAREPEWEAWTLNALGYRVAFARGDLDLAVEHMNAALALLPEPDSERAAVATFLAEALAYLGRLDDAESALREAAEIGRRLGDHRVRAYAAWTWTTLASLRGDAAATIQRIRAVERHPGDWFEHPTGAEFLADAALALARVGEGEAALAYAERARERARRSGIRRSRGSRPARSRRASAIRRWRWTCSRASRRRRSRRRATSGGRCSSRRSRRRGRATRARPRSPRRRTRPPRRSATRTCPGRHEPDIVAPSGPPGAGGHAARRLRRDRRRPRARSRRRAAARRWSSCSRWPAGR